MHLLRSYSQKNTLTLHLLGFTSRYTHLLGFTSRHTHLLGLVFVLQLLELPDDFFLGDQKNTKYFGTNKISEHNVTWARIQCKARYRAAHCTGF
jgi:hypothetical protein